MPPNSGWGLEAGIGSPASPGFRPEAEGGLSVQSLKNKGPLGLHLPLREPTRTLAHARAHKGQ